MSESTDVVTVEDIRRRNRMDRARRQLEAVDPERRMVFRPGMRVGSRSMAEAASYARDTFREAAPERGMLLLGPPGIGKTHIGVAALRGAMDAGRVPGYYNAVELVSRVQATYSDSYSTREQVIEDVLKGDVVMLDDLGKERDTEDVASIIYEVVDRLYRARPERTLIVATNLTSEAYERRYDPAVRSRLAWMCRNFEVTGRDRRKVDD